MTREKHKIASFVRRRYGWKTLMLSVAFAVTICPYSANAEEQAVDAFDDAAYVNEATDINEIEYINETEDVEDSSNLDEFMSDIELDYISANPDPADFSEIDELLAQVPPKLYRFSDASAKALQDALDAIERNRTSEDQEEVDGWAADLRSALEGLTKAGWHTTDQGIWYCYEDQKTWPVSKWEKIDGVWYHFSKDGYLQSGWLKDGGQWYYLLEDGSMAIGWQQIGGKWYFFKNTGVMKVGWLEQEGEWYYLKSSGAMATGWFSKQGYWYFFRTSGKMVTGWKQSKGEWYFFGADGRMAVGWVESGKAKYYMQASGCLATNGYLVRDGHTYHFAKDGKVDLDTTEQVPMTSIPGYYVSPMYAGNYNTAEERIEAMIRCAYDYKNSGTTYKICCSQKPGQYADCSGLVMQCLYAAGFDPAPATPAHHALPENEYDSRTLYHKVDMKHVSYSDLKRGDLVFYRNPKGNIIIHVAIYLGDGKVIESWPPEVTDKYTVTQNPHTTVYGVARPFE